MFGNFLKLAFDIYQPKDKKRLIDDTVKKEIEPFINFEIEKQKGKKGDNPSNIASCAYRKWKNKLK